MQGKRRSRAKACEAADVPLTDTPTRKRVTSRHITSRVTARCGNAHLFLDRRRPSPYGTPHRSVPFLAHWALWRIPVTCSTFDFRSQRSSALAIELKILDVPAAHAAMHALSFLASCKFGRLWTDIVLTYILFRSTTTQTSLTLQLCSKFNNPSS